MRLDGNISFAEHTSLSHVGANSSPLRHCSTRLSGIRTMADRIGQAMVARQKDTDSM
jgi:hypothetical protein